MIAIAAAQKCFHILTPTGTRLGTGVLTTPHISMGMLDAVYNVHHHSVKLAYASGYGDLPILIPTLANDPGHSTTVTNMRRCKLDALVYVPTLLMGLLTVGLYALAAGMHIIALVTPTRHAHVLPLA